MAEVSERIKKARAIWCVWGAALAGLPFVLRLDLVLLYDVSALLAPSQPCLPAIAAVVLVCALWEKLSGGRHVPRMAPVVGASFAVVTLLTTLVCELGWLPMRLDYLSFVDMHEMFDLVGGIAQAASLLGWLAFGAGLLGDGEENVDTAVGRVGAAALLAAALVPVAALGLSLLFPWASVGVLLCVVTAALAWRGCTWLCSRPALECRAALFAAASGALLSGLMRQLVSSLSMVAIVLADDGWPLMGESFRRFMAFVVPAALLYVAAVTVASWCMRAEGTDEATRDAGGVGAPKDDAPWYAEVDYLEATIRGLAGGETLSMREGQTLARLAAGNTNAKTAAELGVGPGTVSDYRRRGMAKLGLRTKAELIAALGDMAAAKEPANEVIEVREVPSLRMSEVAGRVTLVTLLLLTLMPFRDFQYDIYTLVIPFALLLIGVVGGARPVGLRVGVSDCFAIAISVAIGYFSYSCWHGYPASRRIVPFLWVLMVVLKGASYAGGSREPLVRRVAKLVRTGLSRVSRDASILVVIAATMVLTPSAMQVGDGYYASLYLDVVIAATALYLVTVWRGGLEPVSLDGSSRSRANHYLLAKGLGDTEAKVILLTAEGLTRSQICEQLCIASGTLNSYRLSGYRKLNVHSARELRRLLVHEIGI